jgi:hypothetical protein
MYEDVHRKLGEETEVSPAKIPLKLDESTDVSNCAQLIVLLGRVHRLLNQTRVHIL